MFTIFQFIVSYFYFLVLKNLIITNKDYWNVIRVVVINETILHFLTKHDEYYKLSIQLPMSLHTYQFHSCWYYKSNPHFWQWKSC